MVRIEVIGALGADIETITNNGVTFFSFNVCDNRKVGEREESQWYRCNLNRVSDRFLPYLKRGQQVYVAGIPRYRIYDSAKFHTKLVGVDILVNEIHLVGGAPRNENSEGHANGGNNGLGDAGNPIDGKVDTQVNEVEVF